MVHFPIENITPKEYIYYAFFAFSNHLQLMGDRSGNELSVKQELVVSAIALFDDYTLNLKDTAAMLGTSSQNVKKIVNILIKKGFAVMKKDKSDNRNLRVALTRKGKNYYKNKSEREKIYFDKLFDGFTDEHIYDLYMDFRKLMDNIKGDN